MSQIALHLFIGRDWTQCERLYEEPIITAIAVPQKNEIIEIRENGELVIAHAVYEVRHVFDSGVHSVEILFDELGNRPLS